MVVVRLVVIVVVLRETAMVEVVGLALAFAICTALEVLDVTAPLAVVVSGAVIGTTTCPFSSSSATARRRTARLIAFMRPEPPLRDAMALCKDCDVCARVLFSEDIPVITELASAPMVVENSAVSTSASSFLNGVIYSLVQRNDIPAVVGLAMLSEVSEPVVFSAPA